MSSPAPLGVAHECLGPLEVETINPLSDSRWESEIATHREAGPFHTTAWARVLNETYGHQPVYLRFSRGGKTAALLPFMEVRSWLTGRRGVSLPFSDECRPLFFGNCESTEILDALMKLRTSRRWKHFELRTDAITTQSTSHSSEFFGHGLDLRPGATALFDAYEGTARWSVRKARKRDVIADIDFSERGMRDYYMLHELTRKRHGLPPQSPAFFKNLHRLMVGAGRGFVVIARHNSRAIAGAVFLRFESNAVYKFSASDESARDLCGNNLVMSEAICALAESGAKWLDFGRSSRDNEGLRKYKLSWGTAERSISYLKWDGAWSVDADATNGFHTAVFSRLPLAMNRVLGRLLYRHLD